MTEAKKKDADRMKEFEEKVKSHASQTEPKSEKPKVSVSVTIDGKTEKCKCHLPTAVASISCNLSQTMLRMT